jgi:hypothetical protein
MYNRVSLAIHDQPQIGRASGDCIDIIITPSIPREKDKWILQP